MAPKHLLRVNQYINALTKNESLALEKVLHLRKMFMPLLRNFKTFK